MYGLLHKNFVQELASCLEVGGCMEWRLHARLKLFSVGTCMVHGCDL